MDTPFTITYMILSFFLLPTSNGEKEEDPVHAASHISRGAAAGAAQSMALGHFLLYIHRNWIPYMWIEW